MVDKTTAHHALCAKGPTGLIIQSVAKQEAMCIARAMEAGAKLREIELVVVRIEEERDDV